MTKNPFYNAALASGYIAGLVYGIFNFVAEPNTPDKPTLLIPIVMLSLFVLSAATMSYLFLYQPFMLYFEGKKQEALNLFLQTTGVFAVITAGFVAALIFFT